MRAAGCPPASLAPDTSCCQVPHTQEIRVKLPPGIHRGSGASALLQGPTGPHICSPCTSVLWIWALTNALLAILDAVLSNADHSSASISTNLTVVCHIRTLDFKIQGS